MVSKFIIIVNFVANFFVSVMIKIICVVSIYCIVGVLFRVSAQDNPSQTLTTGKGFAWTLEECIRYAYDNNIQLKQMQLDVNQAENNLLQSRVNLLPNLNASSSYNASKGKTLDMNTFRIVDGQTVSSLSGGISSNLTLFSGFQKKNTIDRNLYSMLASIQNVEKLKNDLSINIALFYLQVIHAQEQLSVAENQLNLTILRVERTQTLVDAGSVPEGDLFEIQSQAAREELQVVTANNILEMSRLNLMQMLDLNVQTDFQIVVPDFSNIILSDPVVSVDDIFSHAESVLPQIKAAEYYLKSSEKQLSIAKGYRSPTLSLSGGYSTRYSSSALNPTSPTDDYPLWVQLKDGVNSYIGLSLNIPIFTGWQIQTGVKNSQINLQNQQYQLQHTKNTLYKEIQQAHADALAAQKRFQAATKAVASMEEAFRYTEQRYELGLMNFVDYTTVKTRLTGAQSDMLQAKFEYIFKVNVLNFYKGEKMVIN